MENVTQASDAPPGEGAEGRPPKVPETEILKPNTSAVTAAEPLGKHLDLCSFQIIIIMFCTSGQRTGHLGGRTTTGAARRAWDPHAFPRAAPPAGMFS